MVTPLLFFYIFSSTSSVLSNEIEMINLPSSCIGLEDGSYFMKLIDDDSYPIISVQCSNEYMIINPSHDENWSLYFTSFIKYHYGVYGADRNDGVNWEEWFIPSAMHSNDKNHFLLSLDCNLCDATSYIQRHSDSSSFYLSALGFGCFNPTRGWPSCDMDYASYECRLCHWNDEQSQILWKDRDFITLDESDAMGELTGICDFEIRRASDDVLSNFHECTTYNPSDYKNFKPSIGSDGRHCQCWKPMKKSKNVTITRQELMTHRSKSAENAQKQNRKRKKYTSQNHIVHLTNADFERGTYRIRQPGTYVIDEDILFDFNAPNAAQNILSEGVYWPNVNDSELYPGAGSHRNAYFLGFFAGISIETNDVILDLNSHSLQMSKSFFFCQPFFSILELSSQPFLPQQGPGFFGADPVFATNVIIKNGELGLSSHHGIHGNYNENITISNVIIRNFQTHGIQLNGFQNVNMKNLEVGPSTNIAYLNGNFGEIIKLMPTLRLIAKETKRAKKIKFNGRNEAYSMNDLLHRLEPLMLRAFEWAKLKSKNMDTQHIEKENEDEFGVISDLFLNPSGLSYGAVTYGIFLNYPSAAIFGWHVNDAQSDGAILDNVYIHDIKRRGQEIVGLAEHGRVFCNAFNGPLPLKQMIGGNVDLLTRFADDLLIGNEDGEKERVRVEYVGDIVTDIHFAMYEFGKNNFDFWPGIPYFGQNEEMLGWAMGQNEEYMSSDNDVLSVYCNMDAMFHPSKGLLGLKISGTHNVQISGLRIENLIDFTDFGHDLCGQHDLYHFSQQKPYQIGYSMNMVLAMSVDFSRVSVSGDGIWINGVYSSTGLTFGISAWFDTRIEYKLGTNVDIFNVYAGFGIDEGSKYQSLTFEDRPNKAAEACAVRSYSSDNYKAMNVFEDGESVIDIQCIEGQVGCFGNLDKIYTNFGVVTESKKCQIRPIVHFYDGRMSFDDDGNSLFDSSEPMFYAIIVLVVLICLCLSKRVYHDYPMKKAIKSNFKYELIKTKDADNELYGCYE